MEKKTLGIIGGLGPMASARFLSLLTDITAAKVDQDHMEVLLYSRPQTPDRTAYLLGQSQENPLPLLLDTAQRLIQMGAGVLAMPCMTAYGFGAALSEQISVPLLHPIALTAQTLKENGVQSAGILATDGSLRVGLFQQYLTKAGVQPILPTAELQAEIMAIIYEEVKAGKPVDLERFFSVAHAMRKLGAQVLILGCTELSVIKQDQAIGKGFLDAMEVLAKAAVESCGYQVRSDFSLL